MVVLRHSGVRWWIGSDTSVSGGTSALDDTSTSLGGPSVVWQNYGGGTAAALRRPLVVRWWCGIPTAVVRQHSGGGRGGVRWMELSSFFSLGFILLFHEEMWFYL
ncbi:hypothetical protein MA16_Dca019086 [Dendrobium catenatum]|uniref:Uncharacterized protein n=1 Tax=Dendrobium catenatum TaxID=906689 RepID=A0A2I0WP79_9ASPA|nr:hypothetical protein MA16_Dca019086 [Dendrobium catenatum]